MAFKNRTNEEKLNNQGVKMKIINYRGTNDIDVEFEGGFIRYGVKYGSFKKGAIDHTDYTKRLGTTIQNQAGSKVTVIDYKNSDEVIIKFDNGYITTVPWGNFKIGSIQSPYCKTMCKTGYLGEGQYTPQDQWYNYWRAMIERVYRKNHFAERWYSAVGVCEEWHNYQNFAQWCADNFYKVKDSKMNLDKDIIVKHNKIYSPQTCVFVPHFINTLFIRAENTRGDLPIGVYWHERDQEYRAQCSYIDVEIGKRKNKWLGGYDNSDDAFNAYKSFKENHIKYLANYYKEYIPENLYNVMINYEVEITD